MTYQREYYKSDAFLWTSEEKIILPKFVWELGRVMTSTSGCHLTGKGVKNYLLHGRWDGMHIPLAPQYQ